MSRVKVFTAEWCAPCKVLKAALKDQDDFEYELIDIDENEVLVQLHSIRSIPTVHVTFDEGWEDAEVLVGNKATVSNILEVLNGR